MRHDLTPAWTVIIVPPKLTAAPRRLGVKKRTIRLLVTLAIVVAVLPWAWTYVASDTAAMLADRLVESQALTVELQDSVQSVRMAAAAAEARKLPPVGMLMPVNGSISSPFASSRLHPILGIFRAHKGVDLVAPTGTPIAAPAEGLVVSVGRRLGYGLTIEVAHTGGVVTRYAHCSKVMVQRGDSVSKGQTIGAVGATGLVTGPHLHFEVLVRGRSVDPIRFIASTHLATPGAAAH